MQKAAVLTPVIRVPSASTATLAAVAGQVRFSSYQLYFYPAQFALTRIQGLHKAAQAVRADRTHLPAAQAQAAFQMATECMMGQFLVVADTDRLRLFDHLLDTIAGTRSFEGLATPFLSGLNTAGLNNDTARIGRATQLWHQYGTTAHTGSKQTTAYLVDGSTKTIVVITSANLKALAPGGAQASMLQAGSIGHLSLQLQTAGLIDAGVAQDGDPCKGAWKLGAGIVGAIVGGSASGAATLGTTAVGGAAVGFSAGVAIGDIAGDFFCGSGKPASEGTGGSAADGAAIDTSTGGEDNQTTVDQTEQTTGPQNTQTTDDNSGTDDNSSDDNHDNSGDMPNPDDPHGIPNPDDPHGMVGFTNTYATSGADALVTVTASGAWMCLGVPQLTSAGGLAAAGALAAIPGIAALVGSQVSAASKSGIAQIGLTDVSRATVATIVAAGAGNIALGSKLTGVATAGKQATGVAGG